MLSRDAGARSDRPAATELGQAVGRLVRPNVRGLSLLAAVALLVAAILSIRLVWPGGLAGDLGRSRSALSHERASAAGALSGYPSEPERTAASSALLRLLRDRSEFVRGAAAEGLGQLRYREAVPGLVALLDDSSDAVVFDAARALALMRDERAYLPLRETALAGARAGQRSAAAEALGNWGGRSSLATLRRILQKDPDSTVRRSAVLGLARIGTPEALRAIRPAQDSDDVDGTAAREALKGRHDNR